MKKTRTNTPAPTTLDREGLTAELERIRLARETEEKSFKDALEALYANHRNAMKTLAGERATAWERYNAGKKTDKKDAPKAKTAKKAKVAEIEAAA